jgi:hypothetical protein
VQAPDHCNRQAAFAIENLGDTGARANDPFKIAPSESLLIHAEFDCLDRIWRVERIVLFLIGVYQCRERIEPVAFECSCLGTPQPFNFLEGRFVITLRSDGLTSAAMLHLPRIDLVIVFVRADPLDPHDGFLEVHRYYQPVIISLDIEHDPIGGDNACCPIVDSTPRSGAARARCARLRRDRVSTNSVPRESRHRNGCGSRPLPPWRGCRADR